jgi:hypothetical protein
LKEVREGGLEERPRTKTKGVEHGKDHNLRKNQEEPKAKN